MAYKFKDKYVHFRWNDELRDKRCSVADTIEGLEQAVRGDYRFKVVTKGDAGYTFRTSNGASYRFAYYDPNYDCKVAFNEGKQIQVRCGVGWDDIDDPDWGDGTEYRIKPAKPALKWTDLNLGDIIKKGDSTAMVIAIVTDVATDRHIYAGCCWFTSEELELWEKV